MPLDVRGGRRVPALLLLPLLKVTQQSSSRSERQELHPRTHERERGGKVTGTSGARRPAEVLGNPTL